MVLWYSIPLVIPIISTIISLKEKQKSDDEIQIISITMNLHDLGKGTESWSQGGRTMMIVWRPQNNRWSFWNKKIVR